VDLPPGTVKASFDEVFSLTALTPHAVLPDEPSPAHSVADLSTSQRNLSDHAAAEVANGKGTKLLAASHAGGEPFLLLVAPSGRVLGVSAGSDIGLKLVDRSDPTGWARRQTWELQPIGATP
jgi:hypothetical protein